MVRGEDGADYPGNLREIAGSDIREEINGKLRAESVLVKDGSRILIILEIGKNVVGENAVENSLVRRGIYLPGDAASLKLLGHGGVSEASIKRRTIVDDGLENGTAVGASGIERRGHGVKAIRVSGTHH